MPPLLLLTAGRGHLDGLSREEWLAHPVQLFQHGAAQLVSYDATKVSGQRRDPLIVAAEWAQRGGNAEPLRHASLRGPAELRDRLRGYLAAHAPPSGPPDAHHVGVTAYRPGGGGMHLFVDCTNGPSGVSWASFDPRGEERALADDLRDLARAVGHLAGDDVTCHVVATGHGAHWYFTGTTVSYETWTRFLGLLLAWPGPARNHLDEFWLAAALVSRNACLRWSWGGSQGLPRVIHSLHP